MKNSPPHNIFLVIVILLVAALFMHSTLTGRVVQEQKTERSLLKCGDTITCTMSSPVKLTAKDPVTQEVCRTGPALKIGCNNIVIDGGRFTLRVGAGNFPAIQVRSRGGVTLQNFVLEGGGMELDFFNNGIIRNNIFRNMDTGIILSGSSTNNEFRNNYFGSKQTGISYQTKKAGTNLMIWNDFYSKQSIDLRSKHLPVLCEGKMGNYLAPGVQEPLQLQEKSSCGTNKEPFTAEGKKVRKKA